MNAATPQTVIEKVNPEHPWMDSTYWLEFCEALAAADGDPADKIAQWGDRVGQIWSDKDRVIPGPWLDDLLEGKVHPLLPLTRVLAFGEATVYKQEHGNKLLPLEDDHVRTLASTPALSGITGILMQARSYRIGPQHVQILASSPHLTNITYFATKSFSGGLGTEGLEIIARSPNFSRLEHLELYYNRVGDSGLIALLDSSNIQHLKHLDISRDTLKAAGIKALAQCAALAGLEHLNLNWNNLSSGAISALAKSPHLRRLKTLHLNFNKTGNKGAIALAKSPILATVEDLDLSASSIGNAGMIALAQSPHLGCLRKVIFGNNDWGQRGALALADAASMGPQLEELDLYAVNVGPQGGTALARSPKFPKLSMVKFATHQPELDAAACRVLKDWAPLYDSTRSSVRSRLDKLQALEAVPEQKKGVDISSVRAKVASTAALTPEAAQWERLAFYLGEMSNRNPLQTTALLPALEAELAAWPDELRVVPREWLHRLQYEDTVPVAARLMRTAECYTDQISRVATRPELGGLTALGIRNTGPDVPEDVFMMLTGSQSLAGLVSLSVHGKVKPAAALGELIGSAVWASTLRHLELYDNRLTRGGLKALLPTLTGLETFSSRRNRLGDGAVADLVAVPSVASLRVLRLCDAGLSDKAAVALAGCAHLKGLTALDLSGNRLTAAGRAALAGSAHLSAAVKATFS